jgi:hypothetical protein
MKRSLHKVMETFQGTRAGANPRLGLRNTKNDASSFIRTITVGPGISPDLLTLHPIK